MNLKNLLAIVGLGLLVLSLGANYHYLTENKKYEEQLKEAESQTASFCGGQDFGKLRITSVVCKEKREICMCGDPSSLQGM